MEVKTRAYNFVVDEYPPDVGCEIFPQCLQCPLPMCADEIKAIGNSVKLFKKRGVILSVFKWRDKGFTKPEISKTFDIPIYTVIGWIKKRNKIMKLFNEYKRYIDYILEYEVENKLL